MQMDMLDKWEMLCSLYEKYEQIQRLLGGGPHFFLQVLMLYLIL